MELTTSRRTLYEPVITRELPEVKKAYWAGFFDGEGSLGVYIYPHKSGKRSIISRRVSISQKSVHDACLVDIANVYGASIGTHKRPKNKRRCTMTTMQLTGIRAYEFLFDIYPYLGVKKSEAKVFIEYIEQLRKIGCGEYRVEDTFAAAASATLMKLKR